MMKLPTTKGMPPRPVAANSNTPPPKNDIRRQLRKAAGSKDPTALPTFLQNHPHLTSSDADENTSDGRTALHMACWYGAISNVSLLLDLKLCNIDTIATRGHNYGKSPIFFAATRSREDVMNLLLDRGANVLIVNNKGQSVYTIASSHFGSELVQRIQKIEQEQQQQQRERGSREGREDPFEGWIDYSKTHSDGNIYGDLDLRFLGRPLTDRDVVKDGVVNPTTKESRKGNFARNNPNSSRTKKNGGNSKAKKKQSSANIVAITEEEQVQLEKSWDEVQSALHINDSRRVSSSLLAIVQFMEEKKIQSSWVTESASRLRFLISLEQTLQEVTHDLSSDSSTEASSNDSKSVLSEAITFCGTGDRYATLVKRILTRAAKDPNQNSSIKNRKNREMLLTEQERVQLDSFWNDADAALKNDNPKSVFVFLIKVVVFWDGKNCPWLNESIMKLYSVLREDSMLYAATVNEVLSYCDKNNNRHASLVRKMITKSGSDEHESIKGIDHPSSKFYRETSAYKKSKKKEHTLPDHYHSVIKRLREKSREGSHDSTTMWTVLMNSHNTANGGTKYLSLPCPPKWVDSLDDLQCLRTKIHDAVSESNDKFGREEVALDKFLAFDSEWSSESGKTELATIQFSILEDGLPLAWVVDLSPSSNPADSTVYSAMIRDTLRWIFLESGAQILGFAHRHDLHMISTYIGEDIPILAPNFFDVQLIAAHTMAEELGSSRSDVDSSRPGLKSCCSHFLEDSGRVSSQTTDHGRDSRDSWSLSKNEQCSDWAQRPLTANQLEYAGLDAAVLLVLLAEMVCR